MQGIHMFEQAQVVLQGLCEAKARIENDLIVGYSRRLTLDHPLGEKLAHFSRDVQIVRIVLHVARLTEHMHQTHGQAGRSGCIQGTIATQRANIVDQAGSQSRGFTHDGGSRGVNRDNHIKLAMNPLDDRRYTFQLFQRRNRPGAGPGSPRWGDSAPKREVFYALSPRAVVLFLPSGPRRNRPPI